MSAEVGLFLDGLHCAGCVNRTERALRSAPGVCEASVNYTNHRALVRFDPGRTSTERLIERVVDLGFQATPYDPSALERPDAARSRAALTRLLVAGFLAMNVMWIAIALYTGSYHGMDAETRRALRWVAIALSVPAVFWCALPFWKGAFNGLARRELTIDVPIVLGIAISFAVSIAGTLAESEHLYMDSAAVIVFLILLGRTLERSARSRAAAAVDRLTALTPATALRRTHLGFERVAVDALEAGDRVVVPVGELVPADGRVVAGETEMDESPFTGESRPVLSRPGDAVTGGATNLLCEIEIEVTAGVGAGTLARLAALLERAQAQRPQVQRLADRVASVFAPTVVAVAIGTALYWIASGAAAMEVALTAAAVLIVACPCALGLATPAAVTAAVGRAAQLGILVKGGDALERCAQTQTVVLDKTGTLTEGRLCVEGVEVDRRSSERELWQTAVDAEGQSTHPIAVAIRSAATDMGIAPQEVSERETLAGRGVVARAGSDTLRVGSYELLERAGCEASSDLRARAAKLAAAGLSLAWVAQDERVLGVLGLFDAPRDDAAAAIERFAERGVHVVLVTGDHAEAARHAARRTGISDVRASVTPEEKVAIVRALHDAGRVVLTAGDGVNDAAALAISDVGVAMASGSDVTLHAADAVVRSQRLSAVADLVDLSRSCFARIRENLGFAVVYNVVAVPLAVSGWLEPLHAAIAMSLSSVIVTGNAIRLLRWKASE